MKKLLVITTALLLVTQIAYAAPFSVGVGGTGTTTPSGILYGSDSASTPLQTVSFGAGITFIGGTLSFTGGGTGLATSSPIANSNVLVYSSNGAGSAYGAATTSVSCSGSASCTPFTIIGASPVTISASGSGGTGNVSTSTHEIAGELAYWTSNSGTPALLGQVATTTISSGSGVAVSAGAGALVGGSNATVSLASISAGVLGTPVTGVPTSQATSTLYGAAAPGGSVLGWSNITNGLAFVATSTGGTAVLVAETPTGTIDGVNAVFTTPNNPAQVFLNSAYQTAGGVDYTLTGTGPYTITFVNPPLAGSQLTDYYNGNGSTTGVIGQIGPAGQLQTGPIVTFSTTTSSFNGLTVGNTITGAGNAINWLPTLSGTLGVAGGGTGDATFTSGQLLYGNGTNALSSVATSSLALNSFPANFSGTLGALVGGANSSWTYWGLATTSQPASSNLLVSNGAAGVYGVATTTLSGSGVISVTAGATTLGSSPITVSCSTCGTGTVTSVTGSWPIISSGGATPNITFGWATTSQPASSNLVVSNGAAGFYGVATSTLTATSPLTGSFTQVGSGGALGCLVASGSQAGCLSSADWNTFNGKGSGTVTSITLGGGLDGTSPITTTGTITAQVSTSSVPTQGQLAYWTGTGTPSSLGTVATSTVSNGTGISFSGTTNGVGGSANSISINQAASLTWTGTETFNTNTVTFGVAPTFTGFTQGSTLFAGASGVLAQDNANYFWDATNHRLGIGTTTPADSLTISHATLPQVLLTDGSLTSNQFAIRTIAGSLFVSTSSPSALATTTTPVFTIGVGGEVSAYAIQPATTTAITMDWNATPNQVEYRIGASATTITLINATTSQNWGARKNMWVCNPGQTAGALTIVGVEWIGATVPTQTTTANKCDLYTLDVTHATSTAAFLVAGAQGAGL